MRPFKLFFIFLSFFLYILVGICTHVIFRIFRPSRRRHVLNRLTNYLIRWFRFVVGIRVKICGNRDLLKEEGNYLISRHIGYIDGIVLGSLVSATFISKKEIKKWPVIGWVVQVGETIFVDRQNKGKISECLKTIEERLKSGLNILIFPEGTSSDGTKINPFQTSFFAAPILTKSDIVPIILEYCHINGKPINQKNRDEICWYGTMPFFSHLWNLLQFQSIDVKVTVNNKIKTTEYTNTSADRKRIAQKCYDLIRESVDENLNLFNGLKQDESPCFLS